MQNYGGQNFRSRYRDNLKNGNFRRARSRSRARNIQVILEEMSKIVGGPDQVQEQVLIEIGFNTKVDESVKYVKDRINICPTTDQVRYIYT